MKLCVVDLPENHAYNHAQPSTSLDPIPAFHSLLFRILQLDMGFVRDTHSITGWNVCLTTSRFSRGWSGLSDPETQRLKQPDGAR